MSLSAKNSGCEYVVLVRATVDLGLQLQSNGTRNKYLIE